MRTKNLVIYFLLALAASLVFGVFILVRPQEKLQVTTSAAVADLQAIEKDLARDGISTTGLTVMTAPHFLGRDKNGNSWDIKAEKAVQQGAETGVLRLYHMDALVHNRRGQAIRFEAGDGTYTQIKDRLSLGQGVRVTGEKFSLMIAAFTYNLESGNGEGEGAVTIASDLGALRANHVALQNNADRVVLTGAVHAVLKRGQ